MSIEKSTDSIRFDITQGIGTGFSERLLGFRKDANNSIEVLRKRMSCAESISINRIAKGQGT